MDRGRQAKYSQIKAEPTIQRQINTADPKEEEIDQLRT